MGRETDRTCVNFLTLLGYLYDDNYSASKNGFDFHAASCRYAATRIQLLINTYILRGWRQSSQVL
jgi:hypothetical protein